MPRRSQSVEGNLLGVSVSTRAAQPTSARPVGETVQALIQPITEGYATPKRGQSGKGFVGADLIAAWPELLGERLSKACVPVRIRPQPKSRSRHKESSNGGILEVRADPSARMDIEYGQVVIIERLNRFYGYEAISAIRVSAAEGLGSMDTGPARAAPGQKIVPEPHDLQAIESQLQHIENTALRASLAKLGASIAAKSRQSRKR